MPSKRKACIRKTRSGKWRGYIGDVCVAEFEDGVTESAEAAANRWITAPSKPKQGPVKEAEPAKAAASQLLEHIKINCDDVTRRHLEQDPRFLKLYWNMQRDFGDRNYGRKVCLHEAAHAVLMEQDGIKNVRFAGPDIVYNPFRRDFDGSSARAIGDDQPDAIVDDIYIFKTVQHMVAGGVALRLLANIQDDVGDRGDYEDFARKYANRPLSTGEPAEHVWSRAQDTVAARLAEPETRATVLARADLCFPLLYPHG